MGEARDVDTGSPKLLYRIDDGVGIVTFNDPEARNPLGYDLRPVFRRTIDAAAADPEVRCLLLTGAGRAFCAGGNAKAMATMEQPPLEERIRMIRWESEVTAVIHEMPKPVIAALPGAAAGAGFSIALAADLRITLLEMDSGATQATALRNMGERVGLESLETILMAINRGEETGAPMVNTLITQAESFRKRRLQEIERMAVEAPTKMTFPNMMIMISVLLLIVGPLLIQLVSSGLF